MIYNPTTGEVMAYNADRLKWRVLYENLCIDS
jgi:hypothetical protein